MTTPLHEKLNAFVGEWDGEVTVPPNSQMPDGATFASRIENQRALGGWFLTMRYEQHRPEGEPYRALGVLGCEHDSARFTFYWFDSEGWNPGRPSIGEWEGDRLPLEADSVLGRDRLTFEILSPDSYALRIENSPDGTSWTTVAEERFQRR